MILMTSISSSGIWERKRKMPKNLWQKERGAIFRDLVRQYSEEGYNNKEAKRLARQEVDEIMEDKEDFVNDIWSDQFDDC